MKSRKGFTLVELMVVILIVGILAAVAIPIMRGRIDSAKWSEGKSMMGTIATAIRAYVAEKDAAPDPIGKLDLTTVAGPLGFRTSDFKGTYFEAGDFEITACEYDPNTTVEDAASLTFTIEATKTSLQPDGYTLDQDGRWIEQ
jgi:prepilin-type N-terminal cleavage/methylation domain-containing protein